MPPSPLHPLEEAVLRSLFSGITGLRQHQNLMDVVSNNIANVNTTGFKTSSVTFEDTLSQLVKSAAAPSAELGGLNPAQIGLGVQLGSITANFGQGSAQNTGKSTDLMIQGDGFFVVRNGSDTNYTRAGAFTFDTNGKLVNPEGMVVQGWVGVNGAVNTDTATGDILLPAGTMLPPIASSTVTIGGNITAETTNALTLSQTVYDSQGKAHNLTILVTPDGIDTATVDVIDTFDDTEGDQGTVTFTEAGAYDPDSSDPALITLADGTEITINQAGMTYFGGPKSLAVTASTGAPAGSLQQFQIAQDGTVIGVFSNGQKLNMAKVALANFNNPAGLEKVGVTCFQSSRNSGLPQVGAPMSGGRGQLLGKALEMSNVDLAQEFTNLIIAQRGFQANSRVITTSDQMLQDLVDIKR
jgi:flagellar hook protein FlgE